MAAKHWCFTLNNYTDEQYEEIINLDVSYLVVGKEVGEQGTPHLQGFLTLHKKGRVLKMLKKSKPHWEVARGTPAQNRTYCTKENDYYEKGDLPAAQNERGGDAEKKRWDDARKAAEEGKFDEIPSDIYIRQYNNLHRIHQDAMPPPQSRDTLANFWIYGATGTGKSRSVREYYGEANIYPKALNKWWDGYKNQLVVLIEEVSPRDKDWLGEKLKVWADHYPFVAEHKGRSVMIRPAIIVITSNYTIEECFPDEQVLLPLQRRFKTHHFISYNKLTNLFE
nr:Rep [Lactuca sativa CRESS virus]